MWIGALIFTGGSLAVIGFLTGVVGCLGSIGPVGDASPQVTEYGWMMFIGGSILYGTGLIVDELRSMKR